MSHQFKPGDLALIIGAQRRPEYIGKTVELLQFVRRGEKYQAGKHKLIAEGDGWVCAGDFVGQWSNSRGIHPLPGQGLIWQKYLMPLRGDFAPEQTKSREVPA